MKVYVIAWDYGYEGYGAPQEVYATRDAAEHAIRSTVKSDPSPEIFELEVEGLEYMYGVRYPLSEEAHGKGKFAYLKSVTYEQAVEDAENEVGTLVRRTKPGEWEEVEA